MGRRSSHPAALYEALGIHEGREHRMAEGFLPVLGEPIGRELKHTGTQIRPLVSRTSDQETSVLGQEMAALGPDDGHPTLASGREV